MIKGFVLFICILLFGTGPALAHQAALPDPLNGAQEQAMTAASPFHLAALSVQAPAIRKVSGGSKADARAALVDAALAALADDVRDQSHSDALRLAFEAYYKFRGAHPEQVRKPYLYFVDFGLDSETPRGYVFHMDALRVVDGPFTVAHGRGSDGDRDGLPTRFSNRGGSLATSLGLFIAQETYTFSGTSAGDPYSSVGLRLRGVSGRFNNAAFARRVVAHGAPYVTPQQAGRSEGCPAMEMSRARTLLPMLANGGLVFLFSPLDRNWMREDPWAGGATRQVVAAGL